VEIGKQFTKPLLSELIEEMGIIGWPELERHFARGVLLIVKPPLTVIEAAKGMIDDDSALVGRWLNTGTLEKVKDHHAKEWNSRHTQFEAIVVAPWVLVQPNTTKSAMPEKS
jgi:hypothetical protein